jgi:hypothetical protein
MSKLLDWIVSRRNRADERYELSQAVRRYERMETGTVSTYMNALTIGAFSLFATVPAVLVGVVIAYKDDILFAVARLLAYHHARTGLPFDMLYGSLGIAIYLIIIMGATMFYILAARPSTRDLADHIDEIAMKLDQQMAAIRYTVETGQKATYKEELAATDRTATLRHTRALMRASRIKSRLPSDPVRAARRLLWSRALGLISYDVYQIIVEQAGQP